MAAPSDLEAEAAVLGCCLLSEEATRWAIQWVAPSDFYKPSHARVFEAISHLHRSGGQIDSLTVIDAMRRLGHNGVTASDLIQMMTEVGSPSHIKRYGEIVQGHAFRRAALRATGEAMRRLMEFKGDPDAVVVVEDLQAQLAHIDSPLTIGSPGDLSGREFHAENIENTAPWVIPGLLRVDERCMMVGVEGGGRSMLLRQIAVAAAFGLHPFTLSPLVIEPIRTLLIDLENPRRITWDWTERISRVARLFTGNESGPDNWRLWLRPAGIELAKRHDRIQLEDILRRHRPQVVCIGPLYKTHAGSEGKNYEDVARSLQDVFDDLRTRYQFALIIEHHAPGGTREGREMRPEGSSLWRRWGEMRWTLLPVKNEPPYRTGAAEFPVRAMRRGQYSGDRDPHAWPDAFYWGTGRQLPWQGYWDVRGTAPAAVSEELI